MKHCRYCGKEFNRGFNLRRHELENCPKRSESSEPEEQMMETYPEYDHKEESEVEGSDMSEESQSEDEEEEMSEDDDNSSDTEYGEDSAPWSSIIEQAKTRHRHDYNTLVENFIHSGMSENEAKNKAFRQILPAVQKEARKVYLENLQWIRQLRKDPIHKKVMQTKQNFIDDDGFDSKEAIDAAVQKRKYLLNKIFDKMEGFDDSDTDED